ncbi:MAG: FHA domain-containing protein, partial [Acidobacteriota bacterium]
LLEGTPRTFTARALCASTVIEIGAALFDRMIRTNVELGVRMLRKLSQRLSAAEALAQQGGIAAVPASVTPPRPAAGRPVSPDNGSRPVNSGRTAPAAAAGKTPSEVFLVNTEGGEIFRLKITDQPLHVGRFDPVTSVRPEVDLTLLDLKRSVSRRHATLTRGGGGFHLTEEVGALNGTRINGTPLTPGQPASLQDGDQISFGSVVLSFKTSPPEAAPSAN